MKQTTFMLIVVTLATIFNTFTIMDLREDDKKIAQHMVDAHKAIGADIMGHHHEP